MNLAEHTKELCQQYGIKPNRSKGQNFLINEDVYDKIIESADLNENDIVLEVGPGLGFLTAELSQKVKRVIAVELDDKLAEILQTGLKSQKIQNIKVLNENVLDFDFYALPLTEGACLSGRQVGGGRIGDLIKYKIVANLPYNITSVFLRKFLEAEHKPELMVLMLQKEVAERIVAQPGEMSLLAVSVQFYADPKIIRYVPKEDFYPQPEVDSAIIKLKVKSEKLKVNEKDFFRLVKFGFSSKRKMLKNNLAGGYHITQKEAENIIKNAGFNPKIRAQELSVSDWKKLLGSF